MVTLNIRFKSIEEVQHFVDTVSKYDCDVDVSKGSVTLDGKSFQGLCTIGLNTTLVCTIHNDKDTESIIEELKQFQ